MKSMGYKGAWVAVRKGRVGRLRRLGLDVADAAVAGWRHASVDEVPEDFPAWVLDAANAGDGVAVGAWIFDSDFGQVVGVAQGVQAAVAVNPSAADEPLAHDAATFARWSSVAPHPVTAEQVDQILAEGEIFAEGLAVELFDRLGLAEPYDPRARPGASVFPFTELGPASTRDSIGAAGLSGYVDPLGFMHDEWYLDPVHVPWRDLRYVPGVGASYVGIWDRTAPAAPLLTYPLSQRGEALLWEDLRHLQIPDRVRVLGLDGLGGFISTVDGQTRVRVAGRDLSYRDARFVLGRGDGFLGIWDRQRPYEPIERFGAKRFTDQERAEDRIRQLLFDVEVPAKQTPGVRLFLPPWERHHDDRHEHHNAEAWFIIEEAADERWTASTVNGGRFYLYGLDSFGEPLSCRGRFATVQDAMHEGARSDGIHGQWREVPPRVDRTLGGLIAWARDGFAAGEQH